MMSVNLYEAILVQPLLHSHHLLHTRRRRQTRQQRQLTIRIAPPALLDKRFRRHPDLHTRHAVFELKLRQLRLAQRTRGSRALLVVVLLLTLPPYCSHSVPVSTRFLARVVNVSGGFEDDLRHAARVLYTLAGVLVYILPRNERVGFGVQIASRRCEIEERWIEELAAGSRHRVVVVPEDDVIQDPDET